MKTRITVILLLAALLSTGCSKGGIKTETMTPE